MKKKLKYRFSISLNCAGEDCETKSTPPIYLEFNGQLDAFRITGINVYQGLLGKEVLIKQIPIKHEK